jgi:hypothetical protein
MNRNVAEVSGDTNARKPAMTVTPRVFAAVVGGLILLVGVAALLFVKVSGDYDAGMFGDQSVDCGTAVVADIDMYSDDPLHACEDALGTRRAWGWPVTGVGLVVLAGGLLIRPTRQAAG